MQEAFVIVWLIVARDLNFVILVVTGRVFKRNTRPLSAAQLKFLVSVGRMANRRIFEANSLNFDRSCFCVFGKVKVIVPVSKRTSIFAKFVFYPGLGC